MVVILILQYFTVIDQFATIHPESILTVPTFTAHYSGMLYVFRLYSNTTVCRSLQ